MWFFFCEALKSTKISSYEPVSSQKYENRYRMKICNFTVWVTLLICVWELVTVVQFACLCLQRMKTMPEFYCRKLHVHWQGTFVQTRLECTFEIWIPWSEYIDWATGRTLVLWARYIQGTLSRFLPWLWILNWLPWYDYLWVLYSFNFFFIWKNNNFPCTADMFVPFVRVWNLDSKKHTKVMRIYVCDTMLAVRKVISYKSSSTLW